VACAGIGLLAGGRDGWDLDETRAAPDQLAVIAGAHHSRLPHPDHLVWPSGRVKDHTPVWRVVAGSFPMLMVALSRGDASRVVPITAAYPVFTAVLASIFLSESFSVARMAGTVLIVAGAVLVSLR